ncbi:MAG: hypothetical protein JSV16_13310 [Candidatus Hydrogenedentota bacterium]|nr:MAG: hypothetical protein JSV16_13310 [Candidatus Hydrogenedentota bacterium]
MANALYDTFKQDVLGGVFDLDTDIIKATLSDAAYYTYSAAHDDYAGGTPDVPATAKTAESPQLGTPSISNGTFDTADFTWSSVATENPQEQILLWDDTLTDDRLIAFYDTGMTGIRKRVH